MAKREKGVTLHPKHGLNPTIAKCVICGGDREEIVLLGAAYKGEAPRSMVVDMEPCHACREKYLKDGIMCVETDAADDVQDGEPAKHTGNFIVLRESAFLEIFQGTAAPKSRIAWLTARAFGMLHRLLERPTKAKEVPGGA